MANSSKELLFSIVILLFFFLLGILGYFCHLFSFLTISVIGGLITILTLFFQIEIFLFQKKK